MTLSHWMEGVGLLAGGLTATMAVPQAVRILRRSDTSGVSPTSYGGFAGVGLTWVVYAAAIGLPAVLISNAVLFATAIAVIGGLARKRARVARSVIVCAAILAISVVLLTLVGPSSVGWWAAILTGLIRVPQLISVGSEATEGVSASAWIMVTTANALWLAYGLYFRDVPVCAGAIVGVVLGAGIIFRTAQRPRALTTLGPFASAAQKHRMLIASMSATTKGRNRP